jgi:hypothetical protein
MSTDRTELCLDALSGSSLLAFMAALGAFRTLAELPDSADLRIKWVPMRSSYAPVLSGVAISDRDVALARIHSVMAAFADHYSVTISKDLKINCEVFRSLAERASHDFLSKNDSDAASIVAAFGCDGVCNEIGQIEDTAFRTMSGAGHQHFLEFMNLLAKTTTVDQLREALFGPWLYRDPSPTMRWDPEDDRRYALRWDEPSKDPVRTVRGANRLAVAALPLFPVVPIAGNAVGTTGFSGRGSRDTFITWPIWTGWLSLDVVRSLLSLKDLHQRESTVTRSLRARGICAVYRSQRITLGKYRNFTPAEPA